MEDKYVFISYSFVNKTIADATCHVLEECGIPCWIAPRNIIPGKTWAGNIVQAIRDCSLMVLIYSEDSNGSSQVANEVDKAFSHGKIIIPFMVDSTPMNDDFGYYLSRKHWLVAYPDYKEMLMPLAEAVATNMGVEIRCPQSVPHAIAGTTSLAPSLEKEKTEPESNPRYDSAIETGRKALLNYELDTAFAELLRPAMDNYKDAQFLVRTILATYPRMHKLDPFRFRFIKEKADAGNAFAQYMMSRYYVHIDKNDAEAYRYASLCAEQGKSYGFLEMALSYEFGTGVEVDITRAHELLDKAVNMDDPFGMMRLAKDHLYGWTRKRNPKRALTLLNRCMEMRVPESFNVMGSMFMQADGVERDEKRGMELHRQAISEGYFECYENLAWDYMANLTTMKYKDDAEIQKGISMLRKGVEYGVVGCLSLLANCYRDGVGVPQKAEQAYRWYKKAAEAGDSFSFYQVGAMLYYGEGCQEDNAEAWKWLSRGTHILSGPCFYQMGLMCEDGYGQEGKEAADCVGYYEQSVYLGGACSNEAALRLYDIFRTQSLEQNPLMRNEKDTYRNYDWVQKDNKRAVGYLKRLAEKNIDSLTVFKYGAILCTEGNEFTDEFEGIRYLKLAAEKREPRAAVMLAQIYEKGDVVDADKKQAHSYYQMAADGECGDGYRGLADELCEQVIGDVDDDDDIVSDMDEETKKKWICQAYEYICKAEELGCKGDFPFAGCSISAFMMEEKLLSCEERKHLLELNEKYVRRGEVQSIVDRGVMYQMGMLLPQDVEKALVYYEQAARLGKECGAKNLGDLYSGEEEGLPVYKQSKPTAAYWYGKGNNDEVKEPCDKLMKEGYEMALNFERDFDAKKQNEYIGWAFPYLCDDIFLSDKSNFRIFEWANFNSEPIADEAPQIMDMSSLDDESRYLAKEQKELFKVYEELCFQLKTRYEWKGSLLPQLAKDDFFPCLSTSNMKKLAQLVYRVWGALVKNGKSPYLQQHKEEINQITLLPSDWTRALDFAEDCTDGSLKLLIVEIVEMSIALDNLARVYWRLIALNGLVENADNVDYHLPDSFVKDFADQFFSGTDVLPRSRAIAYRLYKQVLYLPGVEEKLDSIPSA